MTSRRPKVVVIGQKGIPCTLGGVERFVEEVAARQTAQGYDMVVYTRPHYTDPELTRFRGVRLVSLPCINTKHLDATSHSLVSVLHAIFRERADLIFIVNVGPALVSWIPRLLSPRSRVLGKFESLDWMHSKWGWLARASLKLGAWCICRFPHATFAVSNEIREYAQQQFGVTLPVIHNGYTIRAPMPVRRRQELLDGLDLADDGYFFTATRLANHKGVHFLIRAFIEQKAAHPEAFAGIRLVIAGEGFHTDAYVDMLHKLAAGHADIRFVGHTEGDRLQALYEGAIAFVHPSEAEGFSMSMIEALGYSRLVIASDIPSNVEAATMQPDRYAALLFPSGDVERLGQRLLEAATGDLDDFGQAARSYAEQTFGWDTIATRVAGEFDRALGTQST